jgi:hypothetical protein
MSSTGATADGFDRQFGIGRAGDAPFQLIGNVEALCQSIDPGRVFIGKSLRGRGSPAAVRRAGSVPAPAPMSARHIASTGHRAFLSYSHPDTRSTDMTGYALPLAN